MENMMKAKGPFTHRYQILGICGLVTFLIFLISFYDHSRMNTMLNSTKVKFKSVNSTERDYKILLNINFTFKMLPLVCTRNQNDLLILVHSATDHFNNRKVIRETWGSYDEDIKLLFLVGAVEEESVQKKIENESRIHMDIVQGNFLDTYHNLTYKHVMALKYVVYHCPNIKFLLKVDDDVFVNIPSLKVLIKSYLCQNGDTHKILCSRLFNPKVLRRGKWATSLEDYPEKTYPTYCGGFAILYPHDVIRELYTEAQKTDFFWVDDVFVSGICAKKSNFSHIGIENLVLSISDSHNIVDLSFTNVSKPFLFGNINLNENQIRALWNFVLKNSPKTLLEYLNY